MSNVMLEKASFISWIENNLSEGAFICVVSLNQYQNPMFPDIIMKSVVLTITDNQWAVVKDE